jgi:hypothetical protein
LLEDGGYIEGVALSCFVDCGRLSLRAEYHQTGIRYYTHDVFRSGIEARNVLLGDPLGPRGLGSYIAVERETTRLGRLAMTGAYEVRSGNLYQATATQSNDADFHFVQTQHRPGEHRARGLLTWTIDRSASISTTVSGGIEHVEDFAFVSGSSRTNALVGVAVELRP